jgi:hypothetical protein
MNWDLILCYKKRKTNDSKHNTDEIQGFKHYWLDFGNAKSHIWVSY